MAQEDTEKEDNVKLIIGNLLPNQEATVHLQLINILKVEAAAFCFKVPVQYFPSFTEQKYGYDYQFTVDIHSEVPITYVSYPSQANIAK